MFKKTILIFALLLICSFNVFSNNNVRLEFERGYEVIFEALEQTAELGSEEAIILLKNLKGYCNGSRKVIDSWGLLKFKANEQIICEVLREMQERASEK
jgi:hypothetical protein